jgi:hypothetical protein
MIRDDEASYGASYWPSVSDLFMTLFIIAIALVGSVLFVLLPSSGDDGWEQKYRDSQAEVASLRKELEAARLKTTSLEQDLAQCKEQLADCRNGNCPVDETPNIIISNADRFFALGSAALTPDFEGYLGSGSGAFQQIAAEIIRRNRDSRLKVNTLEIIGHTDGIPLANRGNLDTVLPSVLDGTNIDLLRLKPGSNNDLGLLRALAIKQAWGRFIAQPEQPERAQLKGIEVRTYSAGQTLPVEKDRWLMRPSV